MIVFAFLRRLFAFTGLCVMVAAVGSSVAQDSIGIAFRGAGWMQENFIGQSSSRDDVFNGKSVLSTGVQVTLDNRISDRLQIGVGLGMVTGNTLLDAPETQPGYALPSIEPYVSEADFTYAFANKENSKIWLRGGLFSYTYNPDVKDLGLYLLRGPVHPGFIVSGFERLGFLRNGMMGLPVVNLMGLQLHHQWGGFQGDAILSSETQYYPYFDLSPAYVASYQVHSSFRIGAGVNFYHLISMDPKLDRYYDFADSSNITFSGTKLMATAAFDPKFLLKSGMFGSEDLRLYGEVALIGLENDAVYKKLYGDYLHRMPVMVGFNIPAFNYLDHVSLEVEWYGAHFADDMSGYNKENYTPLPYGTNLSGGYARDNWKWALHTSKTIQKHVVITLQAANDHYRPGIYQGIGDSAPPLRYSISVTPEDWYFTTKLAYFF